MAAFETPKMEVERSVFASGYSLEKQITKRRDISSSSPNEDYANTDDVDEKKIRKNSPRTIWQYLDKWEFLIAPIIFTILAFFTRLYKIGLSPIVTWDEAQYPTSLLFYRSQKLIFSSFGKFGSHYLKREFYFDVHPPLGKMLVGLSGYLAGYNGTYEFKSGERYPDELNYNFMRAFNSFFGAVCVPLAYFTSRELNLKRPAVWFILLDSMLLCFTLTSVLCWSKFHSLQNQSFSLKWFTWLFLTGLSIGCVCSVKWVGLFCTALIGIYTAEDLWNKFGDLRMPKIELAAHVCARVIGLIIIPIFVYATCFAIHFDILENSGPGDAQMSSLFQANLRGTSVGKDSPLEVAYGSRVTIKNMGYGGGLLHSHIQTYPEGSKQQQVTCYHHKDNNNEWWIHPNRNQPQIDNEAPPQLIANGDFLRLIHSQTGRNLHSHEVKAPLTKSHREVSCYGNMTVGDEKDHWTIQVVRDAVSSDRSRIRTLTTAFRLKHTVLGCYLRAGNVNLPEWGFKQIEVTCDNKNNPRDVYTHWNVEAHWNDKLPAAKAKAYKSPFLQDFFHLNVAMMTSNNALVPDPDKQDDLASKYWQWPILHVGLRMCSWDDSIVKYFLLGNPLVYWGSTVSLGIVVMLIFWYILRWQRGYTDLKKAEIDHIHYSAIYPLLGWILHYLPFILMARVTYVHHYYPALYFSILNLGFLVDWMLRGKEKYIQYPIYGILYTAIVGMYAYFIPISWGMVGSNKNYRYMKWFENWRISD